MPYYQGDTVWLRASFYNRSEALHDLNSVVCKIYGPSRVQIGDDIEGADITHVGTGVYETPYTLPANYSTLTYEFSGTDSEGLPQLSRSRISPIFES